MNLEIFHQFVATVETLPIDSDEWEKIEPLIEELKSLHEKNRKEKALLDGLNHWSEMVQFFGLDDLPEKLRVREFDNLSLAEVDPLIPLFQEYKQLSVEKPDNVVAQKNKRTREAAIEDEVLALWEKIKERECKTEPEIFNLSSVLNSARELSTETSDDLVDAKPEPSIEKQEKYAGTEDGKVRGDDIDNSNTASFSENSNDRADKEENEETMENIDNSSMKATAESEEDRTTENIYQSMVTDAESLNSSLFVEDRENQPAKKEFTTENRNDWTIEDRYENTVMNTGELDSILPAEEMEEQLVVVAEEGSNEEKEEQSTTTAKEDPSEETEDQLVMIEEEDPDEEKEEELLAIAEEDLVEEQDWKDTENEEEDITDFAEQVNNEDEAVENEEADPSVLVLTNDLVDEIPGENDFLFKRMAFSAKKRLQNAARLFTKVKNENHILEETVEETMVLESVSEAFFEQWEKSDIQSLAVKFDNEDFSNQWETIILLLWKLLKEERIDIAYQVAKSVERSNLFSPLFPASWLLGCLRLSGSIVSKKGEIAAWIEKKFDCYGKGMFEDHEMEQAYELLCFAALLRPSLFGILQLPQLDSTSKFLYEMDKLIHEECIELSAHEMNQLNDFRTVEDELKELQQEAETFLGELRIGVTYATTKQVYQKWINPGGEIDSILKPIVDNDGTKLEKVKRRIEILDSQKMEELIQKTAEALQLSCMAEKSRALLFSALKKAKGIAENWVDLKEKRQDQDENYYLEFIKKFRDRFLTLVDPTLRRLKESQSNLESPFMKIAMHYCIVALKDVETLLTSEHPVPSSNPLLEDQFNGAQFQLLTLSAGSNWIPNSKFKEALPGHLIKKEFVLKMESEMEKNKEQQDPEKEEPKLTLLDFDSESTSLESRLHRYCAQHIE